MNTLANDGLPAGVRVERRDAHQPVHARLRPQPAVGPLALDADGRALDARLVARLPVQQLDLVALALRPAAVHPQQHLRPVLGVGPARARVDADQRPVAIVGPGQHARELHLADRLLAGGERRGRLDGGGLVLRLVGEIDQDLRVLGDLELGLVPLDRRLQPRLLAQDGLGLVGDVPEVGGARLPVELRYARAVCRRCQRCPRRTSRRLTSFERRSRRGPISMARSLDQFVRRRPREDPNGPKGPDPPQGEPFKPRAAPCRTWD